ncbi:hypothetical protein [Sphingomonas sp.]|uniref:hypothetical protein n=1 Tax=Sphingomonas sp. TaxID=28214 RepID=UPI002ED7AC41
MTADDPIAGVELETATGRTGTDNEGRANNRVQYDRNGQKQPPPTMLFESCDQQDSPRQDGRPEYQRIVPKRHLKPSVPELRLPNQEAESDQDREQGQPPISPV